MPKETIQDTTGSYDVRVGWRPDSDVQVGVETAAGFSLVSVLYGDRDALIKIGWQVCDKLDHRIHAEGGDAAKNEALAQIGRMVLDTIESSQTSPGEPSYTGVWSTLDRAGCNRLIKTVRRARDSAFGRDE